jgi:pSer/pThr/pTyr-binding forkhead associated (FHA) protein
MMAAGGWGNDAATVRPAAADLTYHSEPVPTAQALMEKVEQPARFILRSESGELLQEYPLDKPEIVIGRAPNSDILLSKDKLTSRRHATVTYEHGHYLLRDERSANGTFVNGQQIEEAVSRILQDGDHISIGEHELIFHTHESVTSSVDHLPTMVVPSELTYSTRDDESRTVGTSNDFSTIPVEDPIEVLPPAPLFSPPVTPQPEPVAPVASTVTMAPEVSDIPSIGEMLPAPSIPVSTPVVPVTPPAVSPSSGGRISSSQGSAEMTSSSVHTETSLTFNRLTSLPLPNLPDLTGLIAAIAALDGQVMSLQGDFNATMEDMRNHDADLVQTANTLRSGIRRVSERMDGTIADVARSREALAWAELQQLLEDVQNNPRDIEYVTKLARKARELNKIFQIHQNILSTMAECNSLLRSIIGEEK